MAYSTPGTSLSVYQHNINHLWKNYHYSLSDFYTFPRSMRAMHPEKRVAPSYYQTLWKNISFHCSYLYIHYPYRAWHQRGYWRRGSTSLQRSKCHNSWKRWTHSRVQQWRQMPQEQYCNVKSHHPNNLKTILATGATSAPLYINKCVGHAVIHCRQSRRCVEMEEDVSYLSCFSATTGSSHQWLCLDWWQHLITGTVKNRPHGDDYINKCERRPDVTLCRLFN